MMFITLKTHLKSNLSTISEANESVTSSSQTTRAEGQQFPSGQMMR